MKDTQSEIRQNVQGTNSDRRKPGLKSTIWNKRKKINIHPEQNEKNKNLKK